MKESTNGKTKMNSRRIICAATLLAGAVISAGMAQGQTANTLLITENSSTSLTATLNGVPYTFTGSDNWVISIPGVIFTEPFGVPTLWHEPGETTFNQVGLGQPLGGPLLSVLSDVDRPPNFGLVLDNNTTQTTTFGVVLPGARFSAPLDVTFNDLGDGPTGVPDASATFPLLSLAMAALGLAKRRLL